MVVFVFWRIDIFWGVVSTITLPRGRAFRSDGDIIWGVLVFDDAHPTIKFMLLRILYNSSFVEVVFRDAPTDAASEELFLFMSKIVTMHPFLLKVAAACRPVVLAPSISACAGFVAVAAVISCGDIIGDLDRQYIEAMYPFMLDWELKMSMLCATDVLGTFSNLIIVEEKFDDWKSKFLKLLIKICFWDNLCKYSSFGGDICNNMSACLYILFGSSKIAPAYLYDLLSKNDFRPKFFSIITEWPADVSFCTTSGVRAVLVSVWLFSIIEPIII